MDGAINSKKVSIGDLLWIGCHTAVTLCGKHEPRDCTCVAYGGRELRRLAEGRSVIRELELARAS